MWTETDQYLENLFRKEERVNTLIEKYKNSENKEIQELVNYLEEERKLHKISEENYNKYYQEMYKFKFKARDYFYYTQKLETRLKSLYRLKYGKEQGEKYYNTTIKYLKGNLEEVNLDFFY